MQNLEWQKVHIVRIHEQTCSCGLYQEYLILCCHALAALYHCRISLQDDRYHLVPAWYKPISLLTAYDYIEMAQNEWGEDVTIHTGLCGINITNLNTIVVDNLLLDEDPFSNLVIRALEVPRRRGRPSKRRQASDGKGPLFKAPKPQACSVCSEPRHNRKTCSRLQILESDTAGLGVI
jgi:hypothetical protein